MFTSCKAQKEIISYSELEVKENAAEKTELKFDERATETYSEQKLIFNLESDSTNKTNILVEMFESDMGTDIKISMDENGIISVQSLSSIKSIDITNESKKINQLNKTTEKIEAELEKQIEIAEKQEINKEISTKKVSTETKKTNKIKYIPALLLFLILIIFVRRSK
jgi:preprotein translocase subunit SecF